jgi:tetratricopeptide (TPR) repeat protein
MHPRSNFTLRRSRLIANLTTDSIKPFALNNLGTVWRTTGEHEKAIDAHTRALTIARVLGDRIGQAIALNELGAAYKVIENYSAAANAHAEALDLYNILGQRLGMAETLNHKAELLRASGKPLQARAQYRLALDISRDILTPLEEARSLEGAGRCAADLGQRDIALTDFRQALAIYSCIGAAEQYTIANQIVVSSQGEGEPQAGST